MKRKLARYTLDPAQIMIFSASGEATRSVLTHDELPPAPGTGLEMGGAKSVGGPSKSVESPPPAHSMLSSATLLPKEIPTLYCAPCGGRGVNYQLGHSGLGGIDEIPCLHCNGKGLITQGCHPGRKLEASIGRERIITQEANEVDSPHQWVFPSPTYATCLRCKLTALTVKEPDPLELMVPQE